MGNEKWVDEEWILSLYIYLTKSSSELNKTSPFLNDFCMKLNKYTKKNRTPNSIAIRIANYKSVDPNYLGRGLSNGGKTLKRYWNEYHDKLKYMEEMYEEIIGKTYLSIDEESKNELKYVETLDLKTFCIEDKDAFVESMIRHRNGQIQRIFRNNLFVEFKGKCALCDISMKELLVASHILPYSKCKNKEDMINHFNGLLLCSNHDALFDEKLISFDINGKIMISSKIEKSNYSLLNINQDITLETSYLTSERLNFLSEHRKMFKKNIS